jgi:tRNA threonylcarbamoyladenosine biosynthesis protein TsaB
VALLDEDRTLVLVGLASPRARADASLSAGGAARGASDRVLELAMRALELAGIDLSACDAVAVSRGPGSLTGLRVGIGTARGLAAGAGKPLLGVSTLRALAAGAGGRSPVLALLDAGRGELYGGLFRPGAPPAPLGEERVGAPQDFASAVLGREMRIAGAGAERYREHFPAAELLPLPGEEFLAVGVGRVAAALARTGGDLDPAPRYLRRQAAPVRFEG